MSTIPDGLVESLSNLHGKIEAAQNALTSIEWNRFPDALPIVEVKFAIGKVVHEGALVFSDDENDVWRIRDENKVSLVDLPLDLQCRYAAFIPTLIRHAVQMSDSADAVINKIAERADGASVDIQEALDELSDGGGPDQSLDLA